MYWMEVLVSFSKYLIMSVNNVMSYQNVSKIVKECRESCMMNNNLHYNVHVVLYGPEMVSFQYQTILSVLEDTVHDCQRPHLSILHKLGPKK